MSRLLCQGIIGKRLATEFATCVVLTVRPGAASARRNANPFHFLDAYPPSLSTLSLISLFPRCFPLLQTIWVEIINDPKLFARYVLLTAIRLERRS